MSRETWGYNKDNGPDEWGYMRPDFALCCDGRSQSPIDLTNATHAPLTPITFNYKPIPLAIFNNGTTIRVDCKAKNKNTIIHNEKSYELVQLHFHHPSEHTLKNEHYEMELHLVHQHVTTNTAAVVAVFMTVGETCNDAYRTIFEHLPSEVGTPEDKPLLTIDAAELLPQNTKTFYTYEGSLTTPPCSEIVHWLILTEPVKILQEHVDRFHALYSGNARPTQSVNTRDVFTNR